MNHAKKPDKRSVRPVTILRAAVQLLSFILVPGLFITLFAAVKGIFVAVITGSFVFSEQWVNILLTLAMLLITVLWGRVFCGWICSFGAMQDLLWLGGKHLPLTPVIPEKADRVLKYLKYFVLLFIVVGVWIFGIMGNTVWSPWDVFGMYSSPWKGFPVQALYLSIGGALLLVIIIGSLFIERFFCKYFCPLGALFTITSHFRVFKLKRNARMCNPRCRVCTNKCSMSVPLYKYQQVKSGECINCMKCTTACPQDNIRYDTLPAVAGTLSAVALMGVCFAGTLPIAKTKAPAESTATTATQATIAPTATELPTSAETIATGKYKDGTYSGSAYGYRGSISLEVTVKSGNISDITVTSFDDDDEFFYKAEQKIISSIIEAQDTDVSTVSGATYSSRGIIDAVADALSSQLSDAAVDNNSYVEPTEAQTPEENYDEPQSGADEDQEPETTPYQDEDEKEEAEQPQSNGIFTDGTYYGSGSGYRGTTEVEVTVENGMITDITVTSYNDDYQFFSRAEDEVISSIISSQSIDVSTVSGATFSSNSIIEAVASALGQEFSNPNSSMGGGHGHMH